MSCVDVSWDDAESEREGQNAHFLFHPQTLLASKQALEEKARECVLNRTERRG